MKGLKIDILDDESDLLEALYDFLSYKFSVNTYTDPYELIEKYKQQNFPDILITDIRMPKLNGHQLLVELGDSGFKKPVIMMSGFIEGDQILDQKKKDNIVLIEKPFEIKNLEAKILSCVSKNKLTNYGPNLNTNSPTTFKQKS